MKHVAIAAALIAAAGLAHAVPTPLRLVPAHSQKTGIDIVADTVGFEYYVKRDELRSIPRLRLSLVKDIAGRPGVVRISDIGIVKYEESLDELHLQVNPELLEPQVISNVSSYRKIALPDAPPMLAVIGDYDLRADRSAGKTLFGFLGSASTWIAGNRIDSAMIAGSDVRAQLTHLRVVREDLETSSLIEAGTIPSFSGSRSSPGQIIGIGIRKDRGITPGFITGPQLRVDGISQTQSTIDVLIDNQKTQHTTQPGPFSFVADPVTNGGLASVVVRDDLGQERVVTAQLWANPVLLGIDQTEYAIAAGGISRGGLRSEGFVAAGYYRQGLTNWLTVEAGFEASENVKRFTAAADMATILGDFAVDVSSGAGRSTAVRYVMPAMKVGTWAMTAGASASMMSAGYRFTTGGFAGEDRRYQRGLNLSATTAGWSLSSTFAATPGGRYVAGSVGHSLSNGVSISLTATRFESFSASPSNAIFLSFSIPLDGKYLSVSAVNSANGLRKSASFGGRVSDDITASVNADGVHGVERVGANASFQVGPANANLGVAKAVGQVTAIRGSVRGGFIAHERGMEMSGPGAGEGGFAVVDLGAPGVDVLNGFGSKSTTNSAGFAVLRLPSLTKSRLTIDANSAPDNLDLADIETAVHRHGGVLITRALAKTNGQFVQVEGSRAGEILEIGGERLPVTDRGAWVDLAAGQHEAKINGRAVIVVVKNFTSR